jgi:DNA uptake protein ComE-like DNA-binding protein
MDTTNLKKFLNEITDIISAERKIVFSILLLAFAIKLGFYWYDSTYFSKLNSLNIVQSEGNNSLSEYSHSNSSSSSELFSFDPSNVTQDELIRLGFSPKVAGILINYRTKGGQFRSKNDVKKIFGVTPELYDRIEPFILIKTSHSSFSTDNSTYTKKAPKPIDINSASLEDWKALPGIGDYFAQKFIEKRNGLGAFVNIEQIAEVYNLPDSTFQKIKPYLNLSKGSIRKININSAKEEDLRKHPYILRWQADDILKNRPIYGLEDLYDLKTYSDKSKNKFVDIYFEF